MDTLCLSFWRKTIMFIGSQTFAFWMKCSSKNSAACLASKMSFANDKDTNAWQKLTRQCSFAPLNSMKKALGSASLSLLLASATACSHWWVFATVLTLCKRLWKMHSKTWRMTLMHSLTTLAHLMKTAMLTWKKFASTCSSPKSPWWLVFDHDGATVTWDNSATRDSCLSATQHREVFWCKCCCHWCCGCRETPWWNLTSFINDCCCWNGRCTADPGAASVWAKSVWWWGVNVPQNQCFHALFCHSGPVTPQHNASHDACSDCRMETLLLQAKTRCFWCFNKHKCKFFKLTVSFLQHCTHSWGQVHPMAGSISATKTDLRFDPLVACWCFSATRQAADWFSRLMMNHAAASHSIDALLLQLTLPMTIDPAGGSLARKDHQHHTTPATPPRMIPPLCSCLTTASTLWFGTHKTVHAKATQVHPMAGGCQYHKGQFVGETVWNAHLSEAQDCIWSPLIHQHCQFLPWCVASSCSLSCTSCLTHRQIRPWMDFWTSKSIWKNESHHCHDAVLLCWSQLAFSHPHRLIWLPTWHCDCSRRSSCHMLHLQLALAQCNCVTLEKELLAVIAVLKEHCTALFGAEIHIHADHKNLTHQNLNAQHIIHWCSHIEEFAPKFHCVKGSKNMSLLIVSCRLQLWWRRKLSWLNWHNLKNSSKMLTMPLVFLWWINLLPFHPHCLLLFAPLQMLSLVLKNVLKLLIVLSCQKMTSMNVSCSPKLWNLFSTCQLAWTWWITHMSPNDKRMMLAFSSSMLKILHTVWSEHSTTMSWLFAIWLCRQIGRFACWIQCLMKLFNGTIKHCFTLSWLIWWLWLECIFVIWIWTNTSMCSYYPAENVNSASTLDLVTVTCLLKNLSFNLLQKLQSILLVLAASQSMDNRWFFMLWLWLTLCPTLSKWNNVNVTVALPLMHLNMNGSVDIHAWTNVHMTMALSSTIMIFNFCLQIGASNLIQSRSKICKQTPSVNACISLLWILFLFTCILTLHRWHNKLNFLLMMLLPPLLMLAILQCTLLLVFCLVLLHTIMTCFSTCLMSLIWLPHATDNSSRSTKTHAKKTTDDETATVKLEIVFANLRKLSNSLFSCICMQAQSPFHIIWAHCIGTLAIQWTNQVQDCINVCHLHSAVFGLNQS